MRICSCPLFAGCCLNPHPLPITMTHLAINVHNCIQLDLCFMTYHDRANHYKTRSYTIMMGKQNMLPDNLFLYNICLEDRIRKDHPLRRIKELIDFDFIYSEVKDR